MKTILLVADQVNSNGRLYTSAVVLAAMTQALDKVRRRSLLIFENHKVVGVVTSLEFDGTKLEAELEFFDGAESYANSDFCTGGDGTLVDGQVQGWRLTKVLVKPEVVEAQEP